MQELEASGKTVDEAIVKALEQLKLDRSQVEVEILSEGRTGLFGLGGENARVLVKPLAPPETEPAKWTVEQVDVESPTIDMAVQFLERLLELMDIDATVTARAPETPGDGLGRVSAVLDVAGDDLGILIGRRGSTLAALQYMVNHMVSRQLKSKALVSVDIEHYRRRREESLKGLALRLAEKVKTSRRTVTLEPMPANERRIVHLALADDPQVITSSLGEGETRKVLISFKRSAPRSPTLSDRSL
jgi:spoIIIJ-associated protein